MNELDEEIQQLIAQATSEALEETKINSTDALLPWTEETANQFAPLIQTADGIEKLICDPYFLGLGDYVYPAVIDDIIELYEERKKRIINLCLYLEGIGSGKCNRSGTNILTNQGIKVIEQLNPGTDSGEFAPLNCTIATDKTHAQTSYFYNSGLQYGTEITLFNGQQIGCTLNHPLMTPNGWKNAEELKIGDKIAIICGTQLFGNNQLLTPDESYLAGFIHPDFRFTVSKSDPEFWNDITLLLDKLGCKSKKRICKRRGNFLCQFSWKKARDIFKKEKSIPQCILEAPAEIQKSFISGWFDADGWVNKRGEVSLSCVDKKMIELLQLMLLNLGIFSVLRLKGTGTAWRLKIGPHAHKFREMIGFRIQRKQNKIRKTASKMRGRKTQDKIIWEKIEQIKPIESDHFWDLTVPDHHCFVGNGILSHNTVKFSICQWLQWYELSMHIDPQAYYNLIPGSVIGLINLSRTEAQARRVGFGEVFRRFQCPFVKDYFSPAPRLTKEIWIPQNNTLIFSGTSSAMSALGYNLFGGGIDEACFLEVVEGSKRAGARDVYDAAEEAHNAIFDRMTSRFMKDGVVPGMLIMFSSPRYPDDFLERKIKQAIEIGDDSGIFFRRRSTWSAKGTAFYPSGEYFYVDVDSLDEVQENAAIESGELIFLDHDNLPDTFQTKVDNGELSITHTDRGIRLAPISKYKKLSEEDLLIKNLKKHKKVPDG